MCSTRRNIAIQINSTPATNTNFSTPVERSLVGLAGSAKGFHSSTFLLNLTFSPGRRNNGGLTRCQETKLIGSGLPPSESLY